MGPACAALEYHDATKHHFHRFARSLGYLDWASQPDPFRRFAGAPLLALPREPLAGGVAYDALYDGTAASQPINLQSVAEFLRCSTGLSAWKQYGASRWALRVNPSSGNLHPTETYVVWDRRVFHYAAREHALEERCRFPGSLIADPRSPIPDPGFLIPDQFFLVGLTSIYWREAWKYGERAFRYCQHDIGHAVGALRIAAALLGWRLRLLPEWGDADIAALLGVDRDADFEGAEREAPECLALVTPGDGARDVDRSGILEAAAQGSWQGSANTLSSDHAEWPIIDEVATATRYPGASAGEASRSGAAPAPDSSPGADIPRTGGAREIVLRRRSALGFDGTAGLRRDAFTAMLRRLRPSAPPWDAIDWPPHVHLALFVHRVQDLAPGLYAYLRDPVAVAAWKTAMRSDFLWEPVDDLFLLVPIDCRRTANRVSCDQAIAEDGFFSLAMVARVEPALRERGEWFYRRLFWECGLIGQVLYLEAEAVGARATGIGCFYDDPVHELLGLSGHQWQSLYHFSMGLPVEDTRLTTEPGYDWER